ncbi:MAG: divergent polysaccharide deacetylase family protein [Nitrospinae bacterium]|nr:divergent polysaccharide deacetylase family protein [Nitrospinota bacterium]
MTKPRRSGGTRDGRRRPRFNPWDYLQEAALAVILLALIVLGGYLLSGRQADQGTMEVAAPSYVNTPADKQIEAALPPAREPPAGPAIAIIVDDMGADIALAQKFLALDIPIALAILPGLPHSKEVALAAHSRGAVVMLHLPMEPENGEANPGPGALTTAQDDAEIERRFADALRWAPGAQGVNNHMGSRFTEDAARMKTVLELVRRQGLFFVDSRTSADSAGYRVAREMGLPAAQRDVFLDNERDVEAITAQIEELFKKAARRGHAVGIGHPYPETLEALRLALPRLQERGARVVPVTALLVDEGHAAAAR